MATPYERIMKTDQSEVPTRNAAMSTPPIRSDKQKTSPNKETPSEKSTITKTARNATNTAHENRYDAFTRPVLRPYQKPPLVTVPLPTPDMDIINAHIIMSAREVLENQEDAKGVLAIYEYILKVWLCEIIETRTFVTQHIRHHEDLLLTLLGCTYNHTETNSWARISMHNLNAYSDKMNELKKKIERQLGKLQ